MTSLEVPAEHNYSDLSLVLPCYIIELRLTTDANTLLCTVGIEVSRVTIRQWSHSVPLLRRKLGSCEIRDDQLALCTAAANAI